MLGMMNVRALQFQIAQATLELKKPNQALSVG
jgi:hypothetical protein